VQLIVLDVSNAASVDRAVHEVFAQVQWLDVIINNAGVFGPASGEQRLGSLHADAALGYEHARYRASAQYQHLVENLHADGR
jgi:NAD(P)-dependent dehydrogenase (short-subunit alcohol dehydrogenase family)